jgi:hypothetical protein
VFDDVRSALNDNSREIKQNLTYSLAAKKRLIISSDGLQSDRTTEKGTLGSEAAVLENVHLEHLSTTFVGQSSHAGNNSAAQPDPRRCFGGVWPCGWCSNSKRCKPHSSAGQHGLNLREIVEPNLLHQEPSSSQLPESKNSLMKCDSPALRDSATMNGLRHAMLQREGGIDWRGGKGRKGCKCNCDSGMTN